MLSNQQAKIIRALTQFGPGDIGEVGDRIRAWNGAQVTLPMQGLTAAGYVETRGAGHRVVYAATDSGRAALAEYDAKQADGAAQAIPELPRLLRTRRELRELVDDLGVRANWHAPSDQGVTAKVIGTVLSTTGGTDELVVVISKYAQPVAAVALSTLLTMAADVRFSD